MVVDSLSRNRAPILPAMLKEIDLHALHFYARTLALHDPAKYTVIPLEGALELIPLMLYSNG